MRILSVVDTTTQKTLYTGTKESCMQFIKARKLTKQEFKLVPSQEPEQVEVFTYNPLENEKSTVQEKTSFYEAFRRKFTTR